MRDDGGEDAEEHAIGHAGYAGYKDEVVGVGDLGGGELGDAEEDRGGEYAPEAGEVEFLDEDVRADTWKFSFMLDKS